MAAEPRSPGPVPLAARTLESAGAAATEALGENLGRALAPGAVVALEGELGCGKTTLARGIARGLGVEEGVASPTYTLMHAYQGRLPVYHLDLWMEGRGEAFLEEGGVEWLRSDGVALVEWAERAEPWLPLPRLVIRLAHAPGGRRRFDLEVLGRPGERATGDLLEALGSLELPPGVAELT